MKNSTKYKIIQWVTKLLKYYPPIFVSYNEKTVHIITVFCSKKLPKDLVERGWSNRILISGIMEEIEKRNLISISSKEEGREDYRCEAKLEVIKR